MPKRPCSPLPQAPSRLRPDRHPQRAQQARDKVLRGRPPTCAPRIPSPCGTCATRSVPTVYGVAQIAWWPSARPDEKHCHDPTPSPRRPRPPPRRPRPRGLRRTVDEPAASTTPSTSGSADALAGCTPDTLKTVTGGKAHRGHRQARPTARGSPTTTRATARVRVGHRVRRRRQGSEYAKDAVTWVVVPFNTAIAPGPQTFDLDLNQVSISDERRNAVDFSSGYYDVRQSVITYKGSPIDGKTTVAEAQGRQNRHPGGRRRTPRRRTRSRRPRTSPSSTPTTSPCRR